MCISELGTDELLVGGVWRCSATAHRNPQGMLGSDLECMSVPNNSCWRRVCKDPLLAFVVRRTLQKGRNTVSKTIIEAGIFSWQVDFHSRRQKGSQCSNSRG